MSAHRIANNAPIKREFVGFSASVAENEVTPALRKQPGVRPEPHGGSDMPTVPIRLSSCTIEAT